MGTTSLACFLKYHQRMQAMASGKLFPEMELDARGYISGKASSFFGDYFTAIGVKTDRTHNFRSLPPPPSRC